MPTIFAIDGAEDFGFGELGAYSSGVASLQTALITLGQKVGDSTLASLVLDGLIGPKTTAAANRAFTTFISNGPNFASGGSMSQSQVASAAEELAGFVRTEISRRGGTAGSATAPVRVPGVATPTALSPYSPSSAPTVSDTSASIVKYAAIGLGGVIVASLLYWMYRRSQGRPVFAGGCDFGAGKLRADEQRPYSFYEVKAMATNRWPDLWSVEEIDTPPGTVVRRTEGEMAKHRGKRLAQQFKVRLHSNTGPMHWVAVREDGTLIFDGAGGGRRRGGFGDGERYKTFIRSASASHWGRKRTVDTGLTYDEAQRACRAYNADRTQRQINAGTKMEFTREGR